MSYFPNERYAVDAVGTDSYAITPSPAISAYADGLLVTFKAATANTGAATLAVSGLTAKAIVKSAGGLSTALDSNDIRSGQIVIVQYSLIADNFQMQSVLGNAAGGTPGGSNTQVQYNNSGAFAGDGNMVFSSGTGRLTVAQLTVSSSASMPGTTFNGTVGCNALFATANDVRMKDSSANTQYFMKGSTGTGDGKLRCSANFGYYFANTNDDAVTAIDTGLTRNAASIVEINNGTAGQSGVLLLRGRTIANLPTAVTGMEATVTDGDAGLAWGATAVNTGAGATTYRVWYNGTNWTILGK